jgi:hypothetical protein
MNPSIILISISLLLMVLKFAGVISWSWWIILEPIIFIFCIFVAAAIIDSSIEAFKLIRTHLINRGKK